MRAPLAGLALLVLMAGCAAPVPQPGGPGVPDEPPLSWRAHRDGPTPRTEVAVAAVEERLYALGGFLGDGTNTARLEVYDAARDVWGVAPAPPVALHHTALVAHEGALYVFGGLTTEAFVPTGLAFRFDPAAGSWAALAPLPAPRGAHAAALLDGRVYVAGGFGLDRALLAAVHVYDIAADQWSEAPALPTPRHHLAAAALGGRVLAAGGDLSDHGHNSDALEAFDPATGAWERLAPLPFARGSVAAAAWEGKLVLLGGQNATHTHDLAEAYDPAQDRWLPLPSMPTARHGFGAATWQGRVYALLGGPEPGQSTTGAVESLGAS